MSVSRRRDGGGMGKGEWGEGEGGRDVKEVCKFVEAMIRTVAGPLVSPSTLDPDIACLWKKSSPSEDARLSSLQTSLTHPSQWPTLSYTSAIQELTAAQQSGAAHFQYPVQWGTPLQSEHEKWIAETLIGGPVFVTDYPRELKPFYMRVNDHDERTVACFDLLVPYLGELVGGSVREERVDVLHENMVKAGLVSPSEGVEGEGKEEAENAYKWYLDLRKYGGAPHAGFGMGFERLVAWVGGIENVRECVPMPRWAGRLLL
ncbi:hypothetical protein NMY22_g5119 [Coprinellus aureogranulatus]|nr:hypothetical protein NMY22_g5119 [Coprinellus aureogranulatus]